MKQQTLSIFTITLLVTSCQISKLIKENNELARENNDIARVVSNDVEELRELSEKKGSPQIEELHKISYFDFYSGNIIDELVTDLKDDWKEIKLKEKIVSGQQSIILERVGYINFNAPNTIFIKKDELVSNKRDILNGSKDSLTIISKSEQLKYSSSNREDLFSQKEVDQMLASGNYCFDGFMFKEKIFDYLDITKGSFRGTKFFKCDMDNLISVQNSLNNGLFGFTEVYFLNSNHGLSKNDYSYDDWDLNFWKIENTTFQDIIFQQSRFENCIIKETSFNKVHFKNTFFGNREFGYSMQNHSSESTFENCIFDSVKVYNNFYWDNLFKFCVFRDFDITWNLLSQSRSTKIERCLFMSGRFYSGSQESIEIYSANSYSEFSDVIFTHPKWSRSKIKAWFKEGCSLYGYGGRLEDIDWTTSIFEDIKFNSENAPVTLPMIENNFTNCEFRRGVVFTNCDLSNSTWPSIDELQNVDVKFINCVGAPYNN